ncbi:MAG: lipase family protein [Acidimicrobiales bacterium]
MERFTGSVDDFYVVPKPLPAGAPGDLIRVQAVGADAERTTVRVMYHSTDQTGADRAVTGVVTYPGVAAPPDGWPVISTAHGTTGIAAPCAPSRTATAAPGWGVEGVWAMTDYVGLGPVGELHPYLSKAAEGNAVIDIVRAARQLPDAHAGTRWVSIGHSQGGHGALSAHELAADRAPELELVATVALAPAAMVDRVYGGIDPIVTSILTMLSLVGGQGQYPGMDVADYATPEAVAAAAVMETGCLDEITEAMVPVAVDGLFAADPRQTEPARSAILDNDVGEVAVDGVPLYLASGTKDDRVVIERSRDLFDRLCAAGQVTTFLVVDGADHGSILTLVSEQVTTFIEDALAGRPAVDSCVDGPIDGFFFEL